MARLLLVCGPVARRINLDTLTGQVDNMLCQLWQVRKKRTHNFVRRGTIFLFAAPFSACDVGADCHRTSRRGPPTVSSLLPPSLPPSSDWTISILNKRLHCHKRQAGSHAEASQCSSLLTALNGLSVLTCSKIPDSSPEISSLHSPNPD